MPFIAFDLKALEDAPHAARAAGVPEDTVIAGLAKLWAWCWRHKVDRVNPTHVRGFFGGGDGAVDALKAFGFLAIDGADLRVRGAERYLRISEGRSKGGQAAKGNLVPGAVHHPKVPIRKRQPKVEPMGSRSAAEEQPKSSPTTSSADLGLLHRAPNTEHLSKEKEDPPTQSAGPTRADWNALVAVFQAETGAKYEVQRDSDPPAFKALFAHGMPEVLRRWRRGLVNAKSGIYPGATTVAQLRAQWNPLAIERAPPKGRASGAEKDWTVPPKLTADGELDFLG